MAFGVRIARKCMFTAENLLEIYEQYKEASGQMISQMALHERWDKNGPSELHNSLINAFDGFDFSELTLTQAEKLGMMMFDDYTESSEEQVEVLMLFPLWMFPIVPINIELTNIFGVKLPPFNGVKHSGDTRNGLLSYGMMNYQFKYRKVLIEKYKNER